MIRRDYILRMIEEFIQALARIRSLKQEQRGSEVAAALDAELQKLLGVDQSAAARLSETELLVRLMQDCPTHALRDKTLFLTTLLKEAGDVAAAADRTDESRECYLKALHILLEVLGRGEVFDCPEFVPKVDMLVASLQSAPLPIRTRALLMQHYERTGEFVKAEDTFFAMLDNDPVNDGLLEFGISFYRRLQTQSDAALAFGNLPRAEVDEALQELLNRRKN